MKDNFSNHSANYALYRPQYPDEMYEFILQHVSSTQLAWDCGTGNGQAAIALAGYFEKVFATDISQQQLENAAQKDNIIYAEEPAEKSSLPDNTVNLICISQALHWFKLDEFYEEVKRVAAPGAVIAAWCYSLLDTDKFTSLILGEFHFETLKEYWDDERKMVNSGYKTVPFPFQPIPSKLFFIKPDWTVEQLEGYINTWSAVQHYIRVNNFNPVPHIIDKIKKHWPAGEKRTVQFPVHLRIGYVHQP